MGFSAARLTLFAMLSGVEGDLRDLVLAYLDDGRKSAEVLGDRRFEKASARLAGEGSTAGLEPTVEELLPYTDFVEPFEMLRSQRKLLPKDIASVMDRSKDLIGRLAPIRNRVYHRRPLEFDDLPSAETIARELVAGAPDIWQETCATLLQLSEDPSFIMSLEIPWFDDNVGRKHNLPVPDFDDTGYLGREEDVAAITKHVVGAQWPIITVVGEGGIGKTATALKVAYDVLYSGKCPYEHVIWTTSKTMRLLDREIVELENAIKTSLGMFRDVSEYLAPESEGDHQAEIIGYLEAFPILLVIDNVETILDERLRRFLARVPEGSKVLITSRIGLGELEFRYQLNAITDVEAARLLRTTARVRHVPLIATTPNEVLRGWCQRMHNNPAFIKWFVSAVQVGRKPEQVLAQDSKTFLEFCLANVYEHLEDEAKLCLDALRTVPGRHTEAELAVLTELGVASLQRAVQQLLTTSMISSVGVQTGDKHETAYDMADLARDYLKKFHPVNVDLARLLRGRWHQLGEDRRKFESEAVHDAYGHYRLRVESQTEAAVARHLKKARELADSNDFDGAEELLDGAASLAPDYFEVDHFRAIVRRIRGDLQGAHDSYVDALDKEPNYAPLKNDFGVFLMRNMGEPIEAAKQLRDATALDPESVEVKVELARCLVMLEEFDEASQLLPAIPRATEPVTYYERGAWVVNGLFFIRLAQKRAAERDWPQALLSVDLFIRLIRELPVYLLQRLFSREIELARLVARECSVRSDEGKRAEEILSALGSLEPPVAVSNVTCDTREKHRGVVRKMSYAKPFGFIQSEELGSVFMLPSAMRVRADFETLNEGDSVFFSYRDGAKGKMAHGVFPAWRAV
jgi:Tfp pilus assembly protein PilF/cold shock CspA family protein